MILVDSSSTVGTLAASVPGALRVFDDLRIDYSCTGGRSLADACLVHGLDPGEVVARLEAAAGREAVNDVAWSTRPLVALIDHVVTTYHSFVRSELPHLRRLAADAQDEESPPSALCTIAALLAELDSEMIPHMVKEERILFPYVIELEARARAGNPRPLPSFGPTRHPLREMMREHRHADTTLSALRQAASGYSPPAGASPLVCALYKGLDRLERTMHHHVHLESNVLFPRAIDLERT